MIGLVASLGVANASSVDRFVGPWSGKCGNDVQCQADFEKTPRGYALTVRVSDAMDDTETVCVLEADLAPYARDVLVSADKGTRVMMARTGEVFISGLPTDECAGAVVNGEYVQFADE
jgi:hypothetical protein